MIYGYARVSSTTQSLDTQVAQLTVYGCQKIFQEKLSGRSLRNRAQFTALLDRVTTGDTVVVTKLDRFARSTQDALNTIATLAERSVSLVVLNMGGDVVDTSTAIESAGFETGQVIGEVPLPDAEAVHQLPHIEVPFLA